MRVITPHACCAMTRRLKNTFVGFGGSKSSFGTSSTMVQRRMMILLDMNCSWQYFPFLNWMFPNIKMYPVVINCHENIFVLYYCPLSHDFITTKLKICNDHFFTDKDTWPNKITITLFVILFISYRNVYQNNKQSEWMLLITIKTHLSYSTSHMHNIFLCLRAEENHNVNEYEYCF